MRQIRIIGHRLRSLFRRSRQEDELAREIELHIEQLTKQLVAEGMEESAARREARHRFGPAEITKEECRDMRRVQVVEELFRDSLFALRLFRKSPGFTLTAVISLALGIGANAAIFQLFEAVRLRSLPVERPEELVAVRINGEGRAGNFRGRNAAVTYSIWEEFERRQRAFAGVLAYGDTPLNLASAGELRNVEGLWVSGSFFPVLGIKPHLGRLLSPQDDRKGCGWPGVVISHAFWQREFGGNADVLSRTLPIDGNSVPILGVTPPEFYGVEVGRRFDVAMPVCSVPAADLNNRMHWFLSLMGRLKPGVPESAVRAELLAMSPVVFEATVPPYDSDDQARYAKLQFDIGPRGGAQSGFREAFQQPLTILLSIVVLVLLLACANLANMMLARATAREHEFAVRSSLGASRWRLIRQVLLESFLLALAGAGLGALAAPAVGNVLVRMLSTARDPIFLSLEPNWRVLAFTMAAAVSATVSFGLAPALRAARTETRGTSASREKLAFRRTLLAVQVALSMVLLTAALLFSQSFRNLLSADTGFQAEGVLVAHTYFNAKHGSPERRRFVIEELHQTLKTLPGVTGVARSYVIPISGSGWDRGARVSPASPPHAVNLTSISEDYFRVMKQPLLAGRDFNSSDRPASTRVAIVSQTFAKVFFSGQNPVGKTFSLDGLDGAEPPIQIVGLAGDAKYSSLSETPPSIVYFPASQEEVPRTTVRYLLRTSGSPEALIHSVKQTIAGVDPRLTMRFVVLEAQIRESVLRERLMAALTSAFGLLGTLLALTGVFGVTAYVVARRYREFGVRIALGATGAAVIRMVLGETALAVLIGILAGGALALAAGRVTSTLLYGIAPYDVATMLAVTAVLFGGGMLAGLIPALRASRVAPVQALRAE